MATALSFHAALQFSCGEFLSQAKVCAGKYGGDRAARARAWVRDKAETDPVAVRRVLARALQLNALLVRHRFECVLFPQSPCRLSLLALTRRPRSTPSETIWLADSALAVWAVRLCVPTSLSLRFSALILTSYLRSQILTFAGRPLFDPPTALRVVTTIKCASPSSLPPLSRPRQLTLPSLSTQGTTRARQPSRGSSAAARSRCGRASASTARRRRAASCASSASTSRTCPGAFRGSTAPCCCS